MIPAPRNNAGMMLDEPPARAAVEVDLATGPASSMAGVRRIVAALVAAGADFGDLPTRYPVEWGRLTRPSRANAGDLAALALSASERRLHRESEQVFRVLAVAAAAVNRGAESLRTSVALRGVGRTDLPSLRGIVRIAEYGAATGVGRLTVSAADAVRVLPVFPGPVDTRAERVRCLQALDLRVTADDLRTDPVGPLPGAADLGGVADAVLFAAALDPAASPADRLAAALSYCRVAFYGGNWEGIAVVAAGCLPLIGRLTRSDVEVLAGSAATGGDGDDADHGAIEFEPALLRHPGDVHAYLFKVLGVQASFRGRQDEALGYFRAMRDVEGPISVEIRSQSHLYSALILAKRQQRLPEAVGELQAGFEAVAERSGELASVRRERGWLHNLCGLTLFRQGELVGALEQEKSALACVEGGTDASSVHLRVNLVSNVSVLQESGGRLHQALLTWERFRQEGAAADPTFVKHHAYRAGALQVRSGDVDGGIPRISDSLERCDATADDFHECEIAAELGTLLLSRGRRADAADHFERAGHAAKRLGDPYQMAVAAVGLASASRATVDEQIASLAGLSVTRTAQAEALIEGCRRGAEPQSLLPQLRTKLNRPFDLVNV
jgi:hypothetical protein